MNAANTRKIKVGVNTLFMIPGEVGGTETYLRQTLKAIAGDFLDVSMVLFTNRENDSVLKKDLGSFRNVGFDLLDFAASNRYMRIIREQIELPGRVRLSGVDVLWSPGYTAPYFCSCPQVVTIPDMQYKSFPQDLTFLARMVTDILVKFAVKRSRRLIAISEFSKSEIVKYMLADGGKIDVVPLAVDEAFGNIVPEETRKFMLDSLMIPPDRPYMLSVANTYPHKNISTLVRAFGQLEDRIPHNLVIVGNPRLGENEVQYEIHALKDRRRVIRLSKLSAEQLICLYQGCDLFVFPSLYEGFGLPVLEAMLAGVPVVTTKQASIPEVGGDCVYYADGRDTGDFCDMIKKAIGMNMEQRRQWCEKSVLRAKAFSWRTTACGTVRTLRMAF